jgi:hypothetical protein
VKGQLKVSTPAEYIAKLDESRRAEVSALDALIRKTAPKLEPFVHNGMLLYGRWHHKYGSGREGDWFRIGVASIRIIFRCIFAPGIRMGTSPNSIRMRFRRPILSVRACGSSGWGIWIWWC